MEIFTPREQESNLKIGNPLDLCPELLNAAEAELSAFYRAVRLQENVCAANVAAERWLQIFGKTDVNRRDLKRSLRRITIAAAAARPAEACHRV